MDLFPWHITPRLVATFLHMTETALIPDESEAAPTPARTRRRTTRKAVVDKDTPPRSRVVVMADQSAPTQSDFRKAVEAITVRNVSAAGEITFIQRKAFNAMISIAQKNRRNDEVTFEVPLSEFETLVGHTTSGGREYLKSMARALTDVKVEFDFKGDSPGRKSTWGVANMIAEFYITDDGRGVKFSFPPELAKKILNPDIYNRIDMRMQNLFTSHSALTLFETVSRYWGSPQNETFREHWTAWSMILSGSTKPHSQFREFSKMLNRALDQVNAHETRFEVVPHFSKRDRKMDKLWFVLQPLEQPQLPLNGTPTIIGDEVLKRLRDFGVRDDDITSLAMRYEEEYLLAQADFTDKRMKKKGADPVTSPRSFFMAAVDGNYADAPRRPLNASGGPQPSEPPKVRQAGKPNARQAMTAMREAWKTSKIEGARIIFQSMTGEEKTDTVRRMAENHPTHSVAWNAYRKNGLTKTVETTVIDLMFKELYPDDPTAEELLEFAIENGSLVSSSGNAS